MGLHQLDVNVHQEDIDNQVHQTFCILFIATKDAVYLCVSTEAGLIGFTVEDDDGEVADGPIIAAVCGLI